jgi:hypothetical protein
MRSTSLWGELDLSDKISMIGVSWSSFSVDFTENSDERRTKDFWGFSIGVKGCEVDSAVACNKSTGCDTRVGFEIFLL